MLAQQEQDMSPFMPMVAAVPPAVSAGVEDWGFRVVEQADNDSIASTMSVGRIAPDRSVVIRISPRLIEKCVTQVPAAFAKRLYGFKPIDLESV